MNSPYLGDLHYCRLPSCETEGFRLRLARDEHELGHPELCRNPLCRATADNCLNRISDCCTTCTHRRSSRLQPLDRGYAPFCRARLDVGFGRVVTCGGPSGHDGPHRVGHYSWDGDLGALSGAVVEGRLQQPVLLPLPNPVVEEGDTVTVEGMAPFVVGSRQQPDPEAVERGRQAVKRLVAEADEEARERAITEGRAARVRYGGKDVGTAWVDGGRIELHVSPATARQLGLCVEPGSLSVLPTPVAEGPGNNEFHEVGAGKSHDEEASRRCSNPACVLPPHRGACFEQARFRVSGENGL